MSDVRRRRDAGMTLPELLISMVVIGVIAIVITAAISVTYRAQPGTTGRLNVARSEQNVAVWMPADLSSATSAVETPTCTEASCPGVGPVDGTNALTVSWPEGGGTTTVSYIYRPSGGTGTYELVRVECNGGGCSSITVLRELDGPDVASFVPGVTPVPQAVFDVTVPLEAAAEEDTAANYAAATSTASRIVVSVNGGGNSDGAGGGTNQISITAGGTELGTLAPDSVVAPTFLQSISRCGGPITLVVDESGSVNPYIADLKTAVGDFIDSLAGTPTSVQIVRFDSWSGVLSSNTSDWNRYYNMSDDTEFTEIRGLVSDLRGNWYSHTGDSKRGGTNWEDALFRTFYDATGQPLNNDGDSDTKLPNLVVFFTDGIPTFDRLDSDYRRGALPSSPPAPGSKWPTANGNQFSQVSYDRAQHIAAQFRSTVRLVGVGVGGISGRSFSFSDPGDGITYTDPYGWNENYTWKKYGSSWSRIGYGRDPDNTSYSNTSDFRDGLVQRKKLLGNMIVGGVPSNPGDANWVESLPQGDGTWSDADVADLLISPSWDQLDDALRAIALGQCGGTLTIQTKLPSGAPANANFTYESGGEIVTTSLIARAAAFDLDVSSGTSADAVVTPQSFESSGFTAQGWSCKSRGAPLDPARWSLVTVGVPEDGINVNVGANEAVSCTMTVSP